MEELTCWGPVVAICVVDNEQLTFGIIYLQTNWGSYNLYRLLIFQKFKPMACISDKVQQIAEFEKHCKRIKCTEAKQKAAYVDL